MLTACQDNSLPQFTATNETTLPITTITFADFAHNEGIYPPLIATFQAEQPTIEVRFVPIDEQIDETTERLDKRKIAAMADTAILYSPPTTAEQSLFLSLRPLIEQDGAFANDDFWPNLRSGCPAGLPATLAPGLIYYDQTAFAESGVPEPTLDWNWGNFAQMVQALTQRNDSQINRYGFLPPADPLVMLQPLLDGAMPAGDEPPDPQATLQAIEWYTALIDANYLPNWSATNHPGARREALIYSGQAAMWYGTQTELAQYQTHFGESLGVIAFPAGDTPTTPTHVTCIAISSGTAHPATAWLWLKFLVNQRPTVTIPVRPSIAESNQYWGSFSQQTTTVIRFALDHAWYRSHQPERLAVVVEKVQTALSEGVSLPTALADLEQIPIPTSPPPVESVPVAPPPTTAPGTSITVDYFSTAGGQHNAALEALLNEFHRLYPDIQIRLHTFIPGIQAEQIFTIADLAEIFDCFTIQNPRGLGLYVDDFYNLDPLLALEDPAFINDFSPELWNVFRIENQLYGLPAASKPTLIYYNVDLFNQLGLPPPDANWTPGDLWSLASTAAEHEDVSYGLVPFAAHPANDYGILLPLYGVLTTELIDLNATPPLARLDDSDLLAGLNWLAVLMADEVIPPLGFNPSAPPPYRQWETDVLDGRVPLWTTPIDGPEFTVGIVPPPIASKPIPLSDITGYVISRRAATPYGCWEWIKFLSAQPHVLPGMPARMSVINSAAWKASVGSELATAYAESLSRSELLPAFDRTAQSPERPLRLWLENALIEASMLQANPAPLLAAAQDKAETYLTCLGSPLDSSSELIDRCAQEADPNYMSVSQYREAILAPSGN